MKYCERHPGVGAVYSDGWYGCAFLCPPCIREWEAMKIRHDQEVVDHFRKWAGEMVVDPKAQKEKA